MTIQIGCDNSCTFCIVPIVRGPEISRRLGDVIHEIEALADDGVREVTLLGQNVNSYGRDLGAGQYRPRFADLLRAVDAVPGVRRIRFTSPHPKDLRPETIAAMAECDAVCEQLHLPLQAGSDRTWPACTAATPPSATSPGSTRPVRRSRTSPSPPTSSSASPVRPTPTSRRRSTSSTPPRSTRRTPSSTRPDPGRRRPSSVTTSSHPEVAQDRLRRLTTVVERHALAHHEARIGHVEEILVEGPSKREPHRVSGRTRQGKLVHVAAGPGLAVGQLARVRITDAAPHWLAGERRPDLPVPRPDPDAAHVPAPPGPRGADGVREVGARRRCRPDAR